MVVKDFLFAFAKFHHSYTSLWKTQLDCKSELVKAIYSHI